MTIPYLGRAVRLAFGLLIAGVPALAVAEAPGTASTAVAAAPGAVIGVRVGDHQGFGRIVFDLPKGVAVQSVSQGSRVLLVFSGAARVSRPAALPRNLASLQVGDGNATLTLAPESRARLLRLGDRLVFDVLDPVGKPAEEPGKAAVRAPIKSSPAKAPEHVESTISAPSPNAPEDVSADPGSTPVETGIATVPRPAAMPTASVLPVQAIALPAPADVLTGQPAKPDQPPERSSMLLMADSTVGAAAFRRGDWAVVVLDRRLPLVAPAGVPGSVVSQGVVSTVLRLPLEATQALSIQRVSSGWSVMISEEPVSATLVPQPVQDGVSFPMRRIGRAVTVLDPATGGSLLVGTSLVAGPESAVAVERRSPGFVILPTWLGVAIEPVSDQADLQAGAATFILRGGRIPPDAMNTSETGRRLDLPNEPVPALLNRLRAQLASAAGAPPRARTQPRLAAIQAMLALGLGVEAQALAQTAIADDPAAASDAKMVVANGAAAVIAGRFDEASGLDMPEMAVDPELDLWRGLRDRRLGQQSASARQLPSHRALALSYPEPLRRLIWPDIAEAAAENGMPVPADQMTPFAAALALEHADKVNEAIAAWQAIAAGPDRRDQVRATIRATELQLAAGMIGPEAAADIMERLTYAWRGDGQELALRLRTAELRSAAGGWRAALDSLRATDALFPDQREAIRARKASVFEAMMLADGAGLSPLDVVLLAADYADCVPEDGKDARLARLLAEKLMALDLPARAIPVLQGLVRGTQPGAARAEFGLRLGQLLLDGGDASGAITALQASDAPDLSNGLLESRALLKARVLAAQGHPGDAARSLEAIHSAAADDLRALVLEQSGDWKGSLEALADLADKTVSPDGLLSEGSQSLVIRQATASVQSGQPDQLRRLQQFLPRMSGARADVLRILTASAITSTSELPRAENELKLARAIPKQIQSLAPH